MLSIELSYDLIKNNIGFLFLSILGLVFLIMYILILKTLIAIIYSLTRNRIQTNRRIAVRSYILVKEWVSKNSSTNYFVHHHSSQNMTCIIEHNNM